MKNSKKFNNVAKKGLAVALTGLSLTGGMQNVSAMRPTGTKLELNYLMNVMQNIHDKEMLKKFEQVNKKCRNTFEGTFMNPISVTEKNAEKFFPKLETQYLYSKNDKKIWGEEESKKGKSKYIDCYSFNPHSIDSATRNSTMNFVSGSENIDDLTENEQHICDIANYFIAMSEADFNVFEEKYGFETIKLDNFGNGVQCQIKKFKDRNETPKAFVCVVVPDDGTFTGKNMDTIKQELSNQRLANSDGFLQFDFENVNLVIRPKTRTAKFEIGENAIRYCNNSTINAQGATISEEFPIFDCKYSTINAQGATISGRAAISHCCDSTINAKGAIIGENAICGCKNSTINAQRATISGRAAIFHCFDSTINAQGAMISGKFAIYECKNSTINTQGATISENFAICDCDNSKINAQGATISGGNAFDDCGENSTINVNEEQVYDVAHKVHGSRNVKINGRSLEEIIAEENEKYSNLNDFIEKTFGEIRKDDKGTEE